MVEEDGVLSGHVSQGVAPQLDGNALSGVEVPGYGPVRGPLDVVEGDARFPAGLATASIWRVGTVG